MIRRSPVVVVGKYHCSTIATVKAAEKCVFCLRKWYWDTYRRSPPPSKTKPSRLSHPLTSKSALVFIHTLIHFYIQTFCIIHTIHTYRYTVSNVLSKYAFTSGVDPLFIQSMFTYLRKNDVTIPEIAVNLTFKACNEIVSSRVYRALLLISQCMYVCMYYNCI